MTTYRTSLSFTDRFLSHETFKALRVQDRRLGAIYRAFQLSTLLYIASTIVLQQRYLSTENITHGAVRISLRAPKVRAQTRSYCEQSTQSCLYWDANDILYDPNNNGALITTRAHVKQIGPWSSSDNSNSTMLSAAGQQCDVNVPTVAGCDPNQAPTTILTPSSFVADIEEFTLMLAHSIRGQDSGVEIRSDNIEYGELIDTATGLAVQRWDDQSRTFISPNWTGKEGDLHIMAATVEESSQPSASKESWVSRPQKLADDVIKVGDLLNAAGVQLDSFSKSPMATKNETVRSTGVVVIVIIQYAAMGWNPNRISYRYMPKAILDQEYQVVETIRDFQAGRRVEINRHGIKLVISQHGQLRKFSIMILLTNVVAAIALFKVVNILVELMVLRLHPQASVHGVDGGGKGAGVVMRCISGVEQLKDTSLLGRHPQSHNRLVDTESSGNELNKQGYRQDGQGESDAPYPMNSSTRQKQQEQRQSPIGVTETEVGHHYVHKDSVFGTERNKQTSEPSSASSPSSSLNSTTQPTTYTENNHGCTSSTTSVVPTMVGTAAVSAGAASFCTSNSSRLTQLESRRRHISSILMNRTTAVTTPHYRGSVGDEEENFVETRYGQISLSEAQGQPLQGPNPGNLVLTYPPTPPPAATLTLPASALSGLQSEGMEALVHQLGAAEQPATALSKAVSNKTTTNMPLSHFQTTAEPSPSRETITSAASTPVSSSVNHHPYSPPEMIGASPLPVSFGYSRQPSLENLHNTPSPVSARSLSLSLSGASSSVQHSGSCANSKKGSVPSSSMRSSRNTGAMRKSSSVRNLNQRAASSPALMTARSMQNVTTGDTVAASGSSSGSCPGSGLGSLYHRASFDGLSMAISRSDTPTPPPKQPILSFTPGTAISPSSTSSSLPWPSSNVANSTLLARSGSPAAADSMSTTALPTFLLPSTPNISVTTPIPSDNAHNNDQQRRNAFKKQKKDTSDASTVGGECQAVVAAPQAFFPRRVSSGSIFTTSTFAPTNGTDKSVPLTSLTAAFTFRSASADPLTNKNKSTGHLSSHAFPLASSSSDAKGKSVIFDNSNGSTSTSMANGHHAEWLTSPDLTTPRLTNTFGALSSSQVQVSGPNSSCSTPWSPFQLPEPVVPGGNTSIHPLDVQSWTQSASSMLTGNPSSSSTSPLPRLSVAGPYHSSPSSHHEGSRTLRNSASMPILLQGGSASGSSKARLSIVGASTFANASGKTMHGEFDHSMQVDDEYHGDEDTTDEEDDGWKDEQGLEISKEDQLEDTSLHAAIMSRSSPPLTPVTPTSATPLSAVDATTCDPAARKHTNNIPANITAQQQREQHQLQLQSSRSPPTSVNVSAASTRSRPLPPLPSSMSMSASSETRPSTLSSSSLSPLNVGPTARHLSSPHPLLSSSFTAASRSMPSLMMPSRSSEDGNVSGCMLTVATTIAGTSSTTTNVLPLSSTYNQPSSSSSNPAMTSTSTLDGCSIGPTSNASSSSRSVQRSSAVPQFHQQQNFHHTQTSPMFVSGSSSPFPSPSMSSSMIGVGPAPFLTPLTSRSTSDLLSSTPSTALADSAARHLQHFQAQILKHQLKQQQQQQGDSHHHHMKREPIAPPASLFFTSASTAASTSVIPGTGIRVLSRTITMTTAENRKLVLCRSEPLQLCEGVGEEKAARI